MATATRKRAAAKKTTAAKLKEKAPENVTKPTDNSSGPKAAHSTHASDPKGNARSDRPSEDVRVSHPDQLDATDPESYEGKPKAVDEEFVYAGHIDQMRRLPGTSRYLDDVERENAEVARAVVEDRKPDLKNPPATQGTPLYPKRVAVTMTPGDVAAKLETDVTLPVIVGQHEDAEDVPKKKYHK